MKTPGFLRRLVMHPLALMLARGFVAAGSFLSRQRRYVAVAIVFLVAIWYNVVVAPVKEIKKNTVVPFSAVEESFRTADLSGNRPSKTYARMLASVPGDWYRVTVRAQAWDAEETLRVSAVSVTGSRRELGRIDLRSDQTEGMSEYVFRADDRYEDLVIDKVPGEDGDRWRGGEVTISFVSATRLEVTSEAQARALRPTLVGSRSGELSVAAEADGTVLPVKQKYAAWGIFPATGIRMTAVYVNARRELPDADAGYRIEIRGYDPETAAVGDKVIAKYDFSESEIESMLDETGASRLDLNTRLESGKRYFIGISGKGSLSFERFESADAETDGPFIVEMSGSAEGGTDMLPAGASIEDVGPYLAYRFALTGTVDDYRNLSSSEGTVRFDHKDGIVKGAAQRGTSITYALDLGGIPRDLRIAAVQSGTQESQIAFSYSWDGAKWNEMPYVQDQGRSQVWDLAIPRSAESAPTIRVRASFAKDGEDDPKRTFGLDGLSVVATLDKH